LRYFATREEHVVNRSAVVIVVVIFLAGVLAGIAFAKWLVSAVAALGLAVLVVVVALIVYYLVRRRIQVRRERPRRVDEPPAVA
jgi:uncharacterized membrane protein YfcA